MVKSVLVTAALVASGLLLGAGLDRYVMMNSAAGKPVEVRTSSSMPLAQLQPASTGSALDSMQMRAMLKEELSIALSAALAGMNGSVPAATSIPSPTPAVPQQQQQQALQAANDILDAGQWGEIERNTFHQRLAELDPVLREQAMQKLVQAIDNGSLRSADGGPPQL